MTIIYTSKSCGPCIATKHAFTTRGLPFTELPAEDHMPDIEALIERHGLTRQMPIVVHDGTAWNGFDLARIGDLAAQQVTA